MKERKQYLCPVCGYARLENPPSDFNICPSCGTEFGYSDSGTTFQSLREHWVASGANWSSKVDEKPQNWNPYVQLMKFNHSEAVPFYFSSSVRSQSTAVITVVHAGKQLLAEWA